MLLVVQGVTEPKTKDGNGVLLFQNRQGGNDRLIPTSVLPKLQTGYANPLSLSSSICGIYFFVSSKTAE